MRSETTTYLLVFDRRGPDENYLALHNLIKESDHISRWWHYLRTSYILVTDAPITGLREQIHQVLEDDTYLLIEVDLENSEGWLPEKAWEWIYRNAEQFEPAE